MKIRDAAVETACARSSSTPWSTPTRWPPCARPGRPGARSVRKFIGPLETNWPASTHAAGRFHGIAESQDYKRRIEAINFTLAHDDGVSHADLAEADVILVGGAAPARRPPASTWRCSSASRPPTTR